MQKKIPTPELDKMLAVKEKSQAIGEFIEWLPNIGIHLCEEVDEDYGLSTRDENDEEFPTYVITRKGIEELLAAFFDIDLKKCEEERAALLASLQN